MSSSGSNLSYGEGDRKRDTFESSFCKSGANSLVSVCTCRVGRRECRRNICLLEGFKCSSRHLLSAPETNRIKFSLLP